MCLPSEDASAAGLTMFECESSAASAVGCTMSDSVQVQEDFQAYFGFTHSETNAPSSEYIEKVMGRKRGAGMYIINLGANAGRQDTGSSLVLYASGASGVLVEVNEGIFKALLENVLKKSNLAVWVEKGHCFGVSLEKVVKVVRLLG